MAVETSWVGTGQRRDPWRPHGTIFAEKQRHVVLAPDYEGHSDKYFREIRRGQIPRLRALGITLLTVVLIVLLLSDIDSFWKIGLATTLGGVFVGVMMFLRGDSQEVLIGSNGIGDVRIDSSKIPVRGGIGAGILIVVLLSGVLVALPELRLLAAMTLLAGVTFGVLLFIWRRHHAP